jgi:BioD-like phosphotransacetylase family protein
VANPAKFLVIGSIEAYSGKTGIILGLARQLQERGLTVAYGKPLGTCCNEGEEADVQFITQALALSPQQVQSPLVSLDRATLEKRLQEGEELDSAPALQQYRPQFTADIALLEGAGSLWEGSLFGLSTEQIAAALAAPTLLVARYNSPLIVEGCLKAKRDLGDLLVGILLNDIPPEQIEEAQTLIRPFLERQGIAVLGLLPRSKLLRSVSVREIARQLDAKVLCRPDRLDLMVESLTIGAMNVNAALEYFRRGKCKAVVTGGDRTDLQLAALETSTSCLILTGHLSPQPLIVSRAEDLEVPILAVDLDTLATVEIVDRAFGSVRLQEQIKVECIQQLMKEHFDCDRLLQAVMIQ